MTTTPFADQAARLAPYLATLFGAAENRARRLHADAISIEHLVGACVVDEDCAAHEALVHAFADPETVDLEVLALSPGLMVVGSDSALAFSPGAATALYDARATAARLGAARVETEQVLRSAVAALPQEARTTLEEHGFRAGEVASTGAERVVDTGPLFQQFSDEAKRALSLARKAAHQARADAIGPTRLIAGCLAADGGLPGRLGMTSTGIQETLRPYAVDPTPLDDRTLQPEAELVTWLAGLPDGADSLDLLASCHTTGTPELAALLTRHQVSPALLERSRGVFCDPA